MALNLNGRHVNERVAPQFHYVQYEEALYNDLARQAKDNGLIIVYEDGKKLNVRGVEFIAITEPELNSFRQAVADAQAAKVRQDVYINAITVSGQGTGKKTLTISYAGGKEDINVELEDLDTIAVQYDDTELRNEINTLKNTTVPALDTRVTALEGRKGIMWNDYVENL